MKRRIIALLLAGALSLSGVSGLNVHAMEDDETEIIADSTQESEKAEVESIEYSETEQIRESAVETEVEETNEVMEFGETFEGAAIDAGSLHIDKTDVLPGDKIHIGFRVTGDLSLVQYANVVYLMPITGKEKNIRLQYNESTGEFESEFEITDSFEAGLWQIYYASIGDKNYNNIILFNSKVCPTQKNIADFVAGDFKVSGTDAGYRETRSRYQ